MNFVKRVSRYIRETASKGLVFLQRLATMPFQWNKLIRTGPDANSIISRRLAMWSAMMEKL